MKPLRTKLLLTTHIESRAANISQLEPLHLEHYNEISIHRKRNIPLNPNNGEYRRLEECGQLLHIVLRNEGKIVGYLDGLIKPSLHYMDCLTYLMDIIYVSKKYRGRSGHSLLIETAIKECKRRGVNHMMLGYKEAYNKFLPDTYKKFGFMPFDHIEALWL